MADPQTEGRFDQVRGKIRATWGKLTDDDIDQARGNLEQLVGKIKERTGEAVETIRERLEQIMHRDEPVAGEPNSDEPPGEERRENIA